MTDLSKLGNLNHFLPRDFNPRIRDVWIENIAKNIPSGSKIVDIASGNRPYMHLFSHCEYYSHEFEGNKEILDTFRGEKEKDKKHDYTGDITNLIEIKDESFDYVLCTEVLEHTPEPIQAIKELSRICKKGGQIIITTPFTSGLHQEPYHFYSGFSPYFYEYVANKYKCLKIKEIKSQGDFFKLMSWFTNLAMQFRLPGSSDFIVNTVSHYMQSYYLTMSETFGDASGNVVDTSKHFTIGYMIIYEKI
jgi:ubiquinone/menaquinone biosynthesis C-methylase UbiE